MSDLVLPSLAGLGFDVVRTPLWDTNIHTTISGKETRMARQVYPRWKWELSYNVLRSAATHNELQQLAGFFNERKGRFDTFLYRDADDNVATAQIVGQGTGSLTTFQLIRDFGGCKEPIFAPQTVSAVYIDGVAQPSGWSVSAWGTATPGVITFASAPANNTVITADLSFYFPCRMSDDSVSFSLFISQHYRVKKFSFISVKN